MTDPTITKTDNPIAEIDIYDFECTPIEKLTMLPHEKVWEQTDPPVKGRVYVFTEPTTGRKRYFVELEINQ